MFTIYTMASLTGKNIENKLNLMGKNNHCEYETSRDVKLEILKRKIINKLNSTCVKFIV